jgi:hypothetical protein
MWIGVRLSGSGRSCTSALGRTETVCPTLRDRPLSEYLTLSVRSDADYHKFQVFGWGEDTRSADVYQWMEVE